MTTREDLPRCAEGRSRSMRHPACAALLGAIGLSLALAMPASAAVRTASGPLRATIQGHPSPASVTAAYDDVAGTVRLETTTTGPLEPGFPYRVMVKSGCVDEGKLAAPPTLVVTVTPDHTANPPVAAVLEDDDYRELPTDAVATATVSADGRSVDVSASGPSLRGRDWRCVDGGSELGGIPFGGYEALTIARAEKEVRSHLAKRHGATAARRAYVECDRSQLFSPTARTALCRSQLTVKRRTYATGHAVDNRDGPALRVRDVARRSYSQRLRTCAPRQPRKTINGVRTTFRSLHAGGRIPCTTPMIQRIASHASYALPGAVDRGGKYQICEPEGCGTIPYARQVRYSCSVRTHLEAGVRDYELRCANRLGDRFRFAFDLRRVGPSTVRQG